MVPVGITKCEAILWNCYPPPLATRYIALTLCLLARGARDGQAKQVTTGLKLSFWFGLRVSPRGSNFPRVANSWLSTIDVCFFYPEHLELSDRVGRRLLCRVFFFRVYFSFYIS